LATAPDAQHLRVLSAAQSQRIKLKNIAGASGEDGDAIKGACETNCEGAIARNGAARLEEW
jgi:hypothetical protein